MNFPVHACVNGYTFDYSFNLKESLSATQGVDDTIVRNEIKNFIRYFEMRSAADQILEISAKLQDEWDRVLDG